MNQSAPIGVFDSGIGGLTVVRELIRQLPNESIVYFGDTARVPYGPKSPDTVLRYSQEIAGYLEKQGIKTLVVACNTATAHAVPALQQDLGIPVIGVIDPGARAATRATKSGSIGVIGTQGTIKSRAYEVAIQKLMPDARLSVTACPLFVPLAEEGWLETEATLLVAQEYLTPLRDAHIDTLVLGCTHYPLLKRVIGTVVGRDVRLIDSAEETAAETARVLKQENLASADPNGARYRFVASDAPETFLRIGQRFLGAAIERVETVTLG